MPGAVVGLSVSNLAYGLNHHACRGFEISTTYVIIIHRPASHALSSTALFVDVVIVTVTIIIIYKTSPAAGVKSGPVELKGLPSKGIDIVIVIRNPVQVRLAEESCNLLAFDTLVRSTFRTDGPCHPSARDESLAP